MEARYRLQHHVWDVHTSVIDNCQNAESTYTSLLEKLPLPERQFGAGWACMVHVLAAACFPTDLVTLKQDGAGFLPLQILDEDTWEQIPRNNHYDTCRRRTVLATHNLVNMSPSQRQSMIDFWKRIAHGEKISRSLPKVILDLYHRNVLMKIQQFGRLINWYFRPVEKIALCFAGLFLSLFLSRLSH